jgi:hypothetical protein
MGRPRCGTVVGGGVSWRCSSSSNSNAGDGKAREQKRPLQGVRHEARTKRGDGGEARAMATATATATGSTPRAGVCWERGDVVRSGG